MFIVLTILGGVALIQYGVRFLRRGMDRLFGSQLEPWLQATARRPARAMFSGLGLSLLVPSSTGLSSVAVQAVQSGYILPRQMLVILAGADVGLTLMSQLLALRVEQYAPLLLLCGVALYQYTQSPRSRGIGQVVLSFGFLFLGIGIIQTAAAAFDPRGDLIQLLELAERNSVRLAMLSAALAVLFQSSTATVGLFIGLAASNTVPLSMPTIVAGVVGANVGVAFTTLFLGWAQTGSRRMAVANLLSKFLTAAVVLPALHWVARWLERLPGMLPRHVADAHTAFNVLKALLVLSLSGVLAAIAAGLVPAPPPGQKRGFGPRYITDGPIEGGSLALGQSMREILRVSEIVRDMREDWWRAFKQNDESMVRQVAGTDDQVDLLDREIQQFLARVGAENLDAEQSAEQMRQLRFLAELEAAGDVIEKNFCELAIKKAKSGVNFTKEEWRELELFNRMIAENMVIAETTFHTRDVLLAQKLLRHKDAVNRCADELRDQHFARVTRSPGETHETTAVYLDLISNLRRINSHVTHVAYAILQNEQPPSPFRQLLEKADADSGTAERPAVGSPDGEQTTIDQFERSK